MLFLFSLFSLLLWGLVCIDMDRNLDARDHVSRVLNVHLVYQYKHLILLMTMLLLDTNQQQHRLDRLDRLDLCIFSFVPGVGGRVNRLVGRLKNPLVSPVRPSFLPSFLFLFYND